LLLGVNVILDWKNISILRPWCVLAAGILLASPPFYPYTSTSTPSLLYGYDFS